MEEEKKSYPVQHLSFSSIRCLMEDEVKFYKQYIRKLYDEKTSPALIEGTAFHKILELFWSWKIQNGVFPDAKREGEILKEIANIFKDKMKFIEWGKTGSLEDSLKSVSNAYEFYKKEIPNYNPIGTEQSYTVKWNYLNGDLAPVNLKCIVDLVCEDEKGIYAIDHKTVSTFTGQDTEKIAYIIQALVIYITIKANYGKAPYKVQFDEVKKSKNRDGSSQINSIEIVIDDEMLEIFEHLYKRVLKKLETLRINTVLPNPFTMFGGYDSWNYFKQIIKE